MLTLKSARDAMLCGVVVVGGSLMSLAACDRKVVETTRTHSGPDGSTVEKKSVVEHSDGTVTEQKETRTTEVR